MVGLMIIHRKRLAGEAGKPEKTRRELNNPDPKQVFRSNQQWSPITLASFKQDFFIHLKVRSRLSLRGQGTLIFVRGGREWLFGWKEWVSFHRKSKPQIGSFRSTIFLWGSSQCSLYLNRGSQLMFITPNGLHFHHENVLRQDPLLKSNHANITEVPRSCEIIVVPKALPNFIMTDRELAMEIPRGQRFVQAQRGSTGKSFRSNQFLTHRP